LTSSSRDRLSGILAAAALLAAVGAVLALFFVPMVTEETQSTSAGSSAVVTTHVTRPLIGVSRIVQVGVVAGAVLVVAVGVLIGRPPRSALFALGYVSLAFCVVSGLSIGVFFLPVPVLLLAAAVCASPHRPLPVVGTS
jgi:hypothetical protein